MRTQEQKPNAGTGPAAEMQGPCPGDSLTSGPGTRSALQRRISTSPRQRMQREHLQQMAQAEGPSPVVQRVLKVDTAVYDRPSSNSAKALYEKVRQWSEALQWKRGARAEVKRLIEDTQSPEHVYADEDALKDALEEKFSAAPKGDDELYKRPAFQSKVYELAKVTASIMTSSATRQKTDLRDMSLSDNDLDVPHRMPWENLRENTRKFINRKETDADLVRWTDRLVQATEDRVAVNVMNDCWDFADTAYQSAVKAQIAQFHAARDRLIFHWKKSTPTSDGPYAVAIRKFLTSLNSLHGNVPDVGDSKVNKYVSSRTHTHLTQDKGRVLSSPGTTAVLAMTPGRASGVAVTTDDQVIGTDSSFTPLASVRVAYPKLQVSYLKRSKAEVVGGGSKAVAKGAKGATGATGSKSKSGAKKSAGPKTS